METAIEVKDLVVKRGKRRVLHGLTCSIPRGSVTGLLGPSGSGKTTLMRAIVGVQIVESGTVTVLGQAGRRQGAAQPGRLPNPGAERVRRSDGARERPLLRVPLQGSDRRPGRRDDRAGSGWPMPPASSSSTLSGGQRARASLACALVSRPEVLVLDEPTVGQDPVLRDELWGQFRRMAAEGTTLLVSSHVMDEAGRCDRLLLIREGELIADDTPAAVRASTGTADLEEAFLHLIRAQEGAMAMSARILGSTHPAHPEPAAPRPPYGRPARRRAGGAADPAVLHVRARPRGVRPDRAHHARRLPVRDHVPDHQHRHAARAHDRHAGAPAHHPARQDGPALRVRHRLRPRRRRPGDGGLRGRVLALRPGHGWPDRARHRHRHRQRGARRRARSVVQRVRPYRVPGRAVHAHRGAAADPVVRPVRRA